MSQEDQDRWDRKWTEMAGESFQPHSLLLRYQKLLNEGEALDLACGRGQNAIWLAGHGYRVLGVDISDAALEMGRTEAALKGVSQRVRFDFVDLDHWRLQPLAYDLICVFRFLNRRLFPLIRSGLRPGGLLFFSTRHVGWLSQHPQASKTFLLDRGELADEFSSWEVLHSKEGAESADLVARK